MLAALHSRLELSLPVRGTSATLAVPWHGCGGVGGPGEHDQLGTAHAAACRRIADMEEDVAHLQVDIKSPHSSCHAIAPAMLRFSLQPLCLIAKYCDHGVRLLDAGCSRPAAAAGQ